jgi:hypothetical protein
MLRRRVELLAKFYLEMCMLCLKPLNGDLTADHRRPRKMGGSERDDGYANLVPAHFLCNTQKGSKRMPELLQRCIIVLEKALAIPNYLTGPERRTAERLLDDLKDEALKQ